MQKITIIADDIESVERLDVFVTKKIEDISRNEVAKLIENEQILLNFKIAKKSTIVNPDDIVVVLRKPGNTLEATAQKIKLDVIFEDEHLLIVNKEKGMVVHPAPGNEKDTLVNALLSHCGENLSSVGGALRPGIVHRLDKDTSGLLIVAKSNYVHNSLSEQLAKRKIKRQYEAVIFGNMSQNSGEIHLPIGRNPRDRKKMAVVESGKDALTLYKTEKVFSGYGNTYSHIALELVTGRTHQIRVHFAHMGHAIVGDTLYGNPARDKKVFQHLNGQCLHAKSLSFQHPILGNRISFTSELPKYFVQALTTLSSYASI